MINSTYLYVVIDYKWIMYFFQKLGVKILALSRPKVNYHNVFNNIDNLIDEICR